MLTERERGLLRRFEVGVELFLPSVVKEANRLLSLDCEDPRISLLLPANERVVGGEEESPL